MTTTIAELAPEALADLVDSLKQAWREGEPPDTTQALREHPELLRHCSFVVDLAYEEYCLREEAGCPPEAEEFCDSLPAFRSQVREVLRGHQIIAANPALFEQAEVNWPRPGDSFEGLTIIRELGRGAFARVYLALDPETGGRPVVLKLSPAASREARTIGPIVHSHIVGVHWARRAGGLYAICMPFVGSATLRDVVDAGFGAASRRIPSTRTILNAIETQTTARDGATAPAPLLAGHESYADAVATLASRLADALAHLHQEGIAHGDLKPSNILLASGGHPYLIDFNLATGRDDSLLRCGGTLPYMAPERIRLLLGGPERAQPLADSREAARADVYSFGAVLFEALTGQVPFVPANLPTVPEVAAELLQRLSAMSPQFPDMCRVPRSLARLVMQCLAVNPEERPTTEQLKDTLNRYVRRRTRRSKLLLMGLGLMVAGFVAGGLARGETPLRAATLPEELNKVGAVVPPPLQGSSDATQPRPATPPERQPATPSEFFARGLARLRAGDPYAAMLDFTAINRTKPEDGLSHAYCGYCQNLLGNPKAAASYYEKAVSYKYEPAWVHCNWAYSSTQLSAPSTNRQLAQAVQKATLALDRSPNLRAARYTRAWASYQLNLDPQTQTLRNPALCLEDIEAVLASGPYTAELCYHAAVIFSASASGREEYYIRAIDYLHEAVRLGRSPASLARDPVLSRHLATRDDFLEIPLRPPVLLPANPTESRVNLQLADPPLAELLSP